MNALSIIGQVLETDKQPTPYPFYNDSPDRTTPRSKPADYIRRWRDDHSPWGTTYPAVVKATEIEWDRQPGGIYHSRVVKELAAVPVADYAEALKAQEELFWQYQKAPEIVYIRTEKQD